MKKDILKRMNLQLFAEKKDDTSTSENIDGKENNDMDTDVNDDGENKDTKEDKTFTQEELDDIIQKRLARERKKIEEEHEEKRKKEQRLKDLSDEDREKEELKIKEEELEAKTRELHLRELEMDAKDILIEKELPLKFINMVLGEDAESTKENINNLEEEFKNAVNEEVKKKINTGDIKRSTSQNVGNLGVELGNMARNNKKEHNFF